MEKDIPVAAFDIQARAVKRAKRGEWPGIRVILRDAIESIEKGRPIHEGRGRFLAESLERAQPPEQEAFSEAATHLRRREPLPCEIASPIQSFLEHILGKMREASIRQREHLAKNPTEDCSKLFSPNSPPPHHFLDLEPHVATAFRLKKETSRGGRPRQDRPTRQLFDTFDSLRGYGANRTQAQQILAHRFEVTLRTIQNKFEQRTLYTLEEREGEPVLVPHEPGRQRPERALEDGPAPFEPFLKARLATAVWNLQADGLSLRAACRRVAEKFGLQIEGELFGPEIVAAAVRLCDENRSSWARVPLAVCRHEADRRSNLWPTTQSVAEARLFAAETGENPAIIDAVSRDLSSDIPTSKAVAAASKEFGWSYELIVAMCRERINPWAE